MPHNLRPIALEMLLAREEGCFQKDFQKLQKYKVKQAHGKPRSAFSTTSVAQANTRYLSFFTPQTISPIRNGARTLLRCWAFLNAKAAQLRIRTQRGHLCGLISLTIPSGGNVYAIGLWYTGNVFATIPRHVKNI